MPEHERSVIDVWKVQLDLAAEQRPALVQLLSADERQRMERFVFDIHRRRFLAARAALRLLLGQALGQPAAGLQFRYGEQGKPALTSAESQRTGRCEFNVSHSQDLALIAIAWGHELGVDIESIDPQLRAEQIAQRFFSPAEVACLMALDESERVDGFFECWTRKESYVKACGGGLRLPLDQFDVTFGNGLPAALTRVAWDPAETQRWSMAALSVDPGFKAALTAEGQGWTVRLQPFKL